MLKFRWETEFKETEIGEIPREWGVSEIGKFYNLKYGITLSSLNYGNCRLLRQTDLKEGEILIENIPYSMAPEDKIGPYSLKPDDLVISRIANIGTVGYISKKYFDFIDKPLLFGSYLLKFEKIKKINNKFTFYFLASSQMQEYIKSIGEGSTRPNTNAKVVSKFPLIIPPLPEQNRISTVLSWFDDLIENQKRQNEILEKTAMAIFKNWFIDFEPFKDGEFVDSEIGKIPKGWEVKKLKEVLTIMRGISFDSKDASFEYFDNAIPILRANNIKADKTIDFTDLMFIPKSKLSEEKKLKELDLIMVGSNGNPELVGNFALFVKSSPVIDYSFGSFMYCVRANDNNIFAFIFCILNSNYFKEYLASVITGTNITNLKKSDLENFQIFIPPRV